ncbi:MAG: LysR substrate-binding domain-containing protein [Mesorhizobium sp.]|nr:LysR substrate-binding domain-containing protein [Mesorhizobium sp.]
MTPNMSSDVSAANGTALPQIAIDQPALPSGEGSIGGLQAAFGADNFTGTLTGSITLALPAARGLEPAIALKYNAAGGNGPYGLGFDLELPKISIRTQTVPRYDGHDSYVFSGRILEPDRNTAVAKRSEDGIDYEVSRFRPIIETDFAIVERWTRSSDGDEHWRVVTRDAKVTQFGTGPDSRIADPAGPRRVFSTDLKSLAVFRAVVEHGGFMGAQAALDLGQPAVSFHIKALEERVGFRLCHRGRAGFTLTEKGEMVYEHSKTLFAALSDYESILGELRHTITGTLRLGLVNNTISDPGLPMHEVVRAFMQQAPQAQLEITIAVPEQLVTEIGNGGLDIAIIPETRRYKGLKFSLFYEERDSLYAAPTHPIWKSGTIDRATVEKHAFVVWPYANLRELQHFPAAPVKATASNIEAQAMFVLSGHFLGYLPDHLAQAWVDRNQLQTVLADTAGLASPFFIVTRERERRPLLLRTFIRELVSGSWARAHAV